MPRAPRTDPETRRREILTAAHRCFGRGGFHATTMQEVAEEAGLSVGALYRYFAGKEALIQGLAEWGRDRRSELLAGLCPGGGAADLRTVLAEILALLDGEGGDAAARLDVRLWGEALGEPAVLATVLEELGVLRRALGDYLEDESEAGTLRADVTPEPAARVLVALLMGLELQKALEPGIDMRACGGEVKRLLQGLEPRKGS